MLKMAPIATGVGNMCITKQVDPEKKFHFRIVLVLET